MTGIVIGAITKTVIGDRIAGKKALAAFFTVPIKCKDEHPR
jgi:hypothetical protein